MEKLSKVINEKGYLLGVYDDDWIYLQKPSWDCGWYWGFGYLHGHPRNNRTWLTHTHFDSVFFDDGNCTPTEFKGVSAWDRFHKFDKCTLSDDEFWLLLDYMKTFYTLKEAAAVFGRGGSHYTARANDAKIKNTELSDHINKDILPALFKKIDALFDEEPANV